MISCTEYDRATNVATFYIDSATEDLPKAPDLIHKGTGEVAGMACISAGSMAIEQNGNTYVLTGQNAVNGGTWKTFG